MVSFFPSGASTQAPSSSQLTKPVTNQKIQELQATLQNLMDIRTRLETTSDFGQDFFKKMKALTAEIRRINFEISDERERIYEQEKNEQKGKKPQKNVQFAPPRKRKSHKERIQARKECMIFFCHERKLFYIEVP